MNRITRNLQLLWRSERVLAEAKLKLSSRKLILVVAAGIAFLFALCMLNVAGYLALASEVTKPLAALIVALVNLLLAGLLLAVAHGLRPAPEEEMVQEVRDIALGELGAEMDAVQAKLLKLSDDVDGVRASINKFVQRPLDALSPAVIVPALAALTKLARSRKS